MSIELKVPEVGESIKEVLIGDWLKSEGDHVERDEDIVVIETDKATVEVAAPESGTISKVLKRTGDKATVGDVIAYLEVGESKPQADGAKKSTTEPVNELSGQETQPSVGGQPEKIESRKATEQPQSGTTTENGAYKAADQTPTREDEPKTEAIRESRAESDTITSTSFQTANGESKEEEGEHKPAERKSGETNRPTRETQELAAIPITPLREQSLQGETVKRDDRKADQAKIEATREEKIIPMTPIRRRIAEHLVQAQRTTAFLTTFNEIDMSAVKSLREENQAAFREKHQIKLGYTSFFVKASIEALKLIPQVNAEIRGTDLIFRNYYDIGVAVGGGKGLVVPVLRNAELMSFAEIERAIDDFAQRAEKNRLKPDELEGGTFTISNGGIYGSLLSTPILNFPQSGILGLHAIQDRPVVRNGEVVVRPMMYVALTYDHRIVDGREAVTFLKRIKECIEAPFRLLLEA